MAKHRELSIASANDSPAFPAEQCDRQCDLQHGRPVAKQEEQQLEQLDHHFRRVLWCMPRE